MNRFYEMNIVVQLVVSLLMFALMMAILVGWSELIYIYPLAYGLFFIVISISQFLITPFFRLIGIYKYLSPMLIVFGATDKKYDLHSGTSFDYFMVLRNTKKGITIRQKILAYFIEGLLKIVEQVEHKELPETVVITGGSYFFSDNTAERLGFKVSDSNVFDKFNIAANYFDLLWMYSLAHGKLTFPSLRGIKRASTTGKDLVANKAKLIQLNSFLNRNTK